MYNICFNVKVVDPDGAYEISKVFASIPALDFNDSLKMSNIINYFENDINSNLLPFNNLEQIIGKDIYISAIDKQGDEAISSPLRLNRIIQHTPIIENPQSLEIVNSTPILYWLKSVLIFSFTYKIELFRVDNGIVSKVWEKLNISATNKQLQTTEALSDGTYYWTLSVVDEFGNQSRSKEASFIVE